MRRQIEALRRSIQATRAEADTLPLWDGCTVMDAMAAADAGQPEPDGCRRMGVALDLSVIEWRAAYGLGPDASEHVILEAARSHGLRPRELGRLRDWLRATARAWDDKQPRTEFVRADPIGPTGMLPVGTTPDCRKVDEMSIDAFLAEAAGPGALPKG